MTIHVYVYMYMYMPSVLISDIKIYSYISATKTLFSDNFAML